MDSVVGEVGDIYIMERVPSMTSVTIISEES